MTTFEPNTFEPNTFEPNTFEPNTFEPNTFEPNTFEPNTFEPNTFEPGLYDFEKIDDFYNEDDFEYEQTLFLIEQEIINLQPNSAIGLFIVDQQFRTEEATIVKKFLEEGYCIGKFLKDNSTIYIPAQKNTYNSLLSEGMKVTVGAFNTPGLSYPWRSKFVQMPRECHSFKIKFDEPDSVGIIIGYKGTTIEEIKENSLKYTFATKPKINIYNEDSYNCRVEIWGELQFVDIDFIKTKISEILNNTCEIY